MGKLSVGKRLPLGFNDIIAGVDIVMVYGVAERRHCCARKSPAKAPSDTSTESPNIVLLELGLPTVIAYPRNDLLMLIPM